MSPIDSILFCRCPSGKLRVDEMFHREHEAARNAGLDVFLLDHDAVISGNIERALRSVAPAAPSPRNAVYRGWMVPSTRYATLYAALQERGYALQTSPAGYKLCHELPEWYPLLQNATPKSVWIPHIPPFAKSEIATALQQLGSNAAIVKDFVKSEKHAWFEACFVPDASEVEHAFAVANELVRRRDKDFEGGLVIREFISLRRVAATQQVGPPPAEEWRIFWIQHRAAIVVQGFESGEVGVPPETLQFEALAARVKSPFFTMDIARNENGEWIVIELGDGQVAGLHDSAAPDLLFSALMGRGPT